MNCSEWEERLALYMAGDLPAKDTAAMERHLDVCAGCRAFAGEWKESLLLLQEIHRDGIAPADYAAVRARVMAELAAARLPWWRSRWLYGAVVAAAALWMVLSLPRATPVAPRRAAIETPAPAAREIREAAPAPAVAKVRRAARR